MTNELRLYVITDRTWLKENEFLEQKVEEAILGGAGIIQFREKTLPKDECRLLALKVKEVCNKYKVPFIVNDDVMLAKDIDADGVHVGASDMEVGKARELLGKNKIIGATAKTVEQAINAEKAGADYLGSGAVFGTTTKKDAKPMSMELLDSICESVNIPVVAIGGINKNNIGLLKGHKIAGAAVISGVFAEENVRRAAINLSQLLYGKHIIQCITNHVTVNEVANGILAVGGSPIMAHNINEVDEVQRGASGLTINLGATDDYEAMKIAYKTALDCGHPIVIDPVGVGSITFRRKYLNELFKLGKPWCIRGNYGELKAIYEDANTMKGLDSDVVEEEYVRKLAKKLGCIIVGTGKTDIITDGDEIIRIQTGSDMQKMVTGSGCLLSGVLCTYFSFSMNKNIHVAASATKYLGDMAKIAASETKGTMSFLHKWIDYVSLN